MVLKYTKLESVDWTTTLYRYCHMWAKPYYNDTFMADMSTTQLSKSINRYFKGWFTPHISLNEFVIKYDEAVENHGTVKNN